MSRALQVFAGKRAMKKIQENGLNPADVRMILGASGGPKWFVLSRLDQYLNQHFLNNSKQNIQLIGSSIGSWRMACYAMQNPVEAIERLEQVYISFRYAKNANPADVSTGAREMIQGFLSNNESDQIMLNQNRQLNVITARCSGLMAENHRLKLFAGMVGGASINMLSRRAFLRMFERVIFSTNVSESPFRNLPKVKGRISQLTENNLVQSLLASSAIPGVLEGVQGISGAPEGVYRDGGIIDYHFDLPLEAESGIILYPHFSPTLKPGWFDKNLPWRQVKAKNYQDVVLLTPTPQFIQMLPFNKIPDRKDFNRLDDMARAHYWKTAVKMGQRLADDMDELINGSRLKNEIRPLEPSKLK